MNKLKAYTLTVVLSTFAFTPASRAATVAPPLSTQVNQVVQCFTGLFDNSQQVAEQSSVPAIALSNCSVQLAGDNRVDNTQNVYLEQTSTAFNRLRLYSFSQDNSAVMLSIRSFVNENLLRGLCNHPEPERIVNVSNVVGTSCDLELMWEPSRYVANNAPNGCSTSSGGKVVSNVAISDISIDSLDQIFDARGNLLVNTPIEFRRVNSVPEPSFNLGLLVLGIGSVGSVLSGKHKNS